MISFSVFSALGDTQNIWDNNNKKAPLVSDLHFVHFTVQNGPKAQCLLC